MDNTNDISQSITSMPQQYIEQFQTYASLKRNNTSYFNTIKDNPSSLFEFVNQKRIIIWQQSLYQNDTPHSIQSDNDILSIPLTHKNQHIIKNDCLRTRVREGVLLPSFQSDLEHLLTYYCEINHYEYKQGLNEIFGPLLLLKYKHKYLTYTSIFCIGECLINKYIPNIYKSNDFYALRLSLRLFMLLLKYHVPEVYNVFDKLVITPEMYAISWLITLFSSKCILNVVYHIWDYLIRDDDNLTLIYIMVAFLKSKKDLIINTDSTLKQLLMSNLTILNTNEVDDIMKEVSLMKSKTPYSFKLFADKLELFMKGSNNLKDKFDKYQPDDMPVMPIFPSEVIYTTYYPELKCPNTKCNLFKSHINSNNNRKRSTKHKQIQLNKKLCEHCDIKQDKQIISVVLDLRITQRGTNEAGFLPKMIQIHQEELKQNNINKTITERFMPDKDNIHFILLISDTNSFNTLEENFYSEEQYNDNEKLQMMYTIEHKVNKVLNIEKSTPTKLNELYNLKEYDTLKKILDYMISHNFRYVSYAYGGFKKIHNKITKCKLTLLNHEESDCLFCYEQQHKSKSHSHVDNNNNNNKHKTNDTLIKEKVKSLWQQIYKLSDLLELLKEPRNLFFACMLKEIEGINYEHLPFQVFVLLNYNERKLGVYKLFKSKNHCECNNNGVIMDKECYSQNDKELEIVDMIWVYNVVKIKRLHNEVNNVICIMYKQKVMDEEKNESVTVQRKMIIGCEKNDYKKLVQLISQITKK